MTDSRPTPPHSDAAAEGMPPPEWDVLGEDFRSFPPPPARDAVDLQPLYALLEAVRAMVPQELHGQFSVLVRELLLAVRALIDWYLERMDGRTRPTPVEDIPIE